MKKIYKYLSSDLIDLIFTSSGYVQLKASFPRDFNDPYELFLGINPTGIDSEIIAYYQETVENIPQIPTMAAPVFLDTEMV